MNDNVIQLTDASFDGLVLKNQQSAVLVDFWAEWCGPCKAIAPIVSEIAVEYQGKLIVAKLDVDTNSETAQKYHVRTIPTLLLLKNGSVVATKVGSVSKGELTRFLDDNL